MALFKNELEKKKEIHRQFWQGKGPCLIFITTPELANLNPDTETLDKYDVVGYKEKFYSPVKMWEAEVRRAREVLHWPTDGIATVRPNLGTVFIPAMVGQDFQILENQMPQAGQPLSIEEIRNIRLKDVMNSQLMHLAEEFYAVHKQSNEPDIAAYLPDTQGVFDFANMIYGEHIFLDMGRKHPNVKDVMDKCFELYVHVSQHLKQVLGEPANSMIHGHGTPQGLFFPNAGVRMSEDSTTLVSTEMIEEFILPYIIKAAEPFGGVFIHYCGHHTGLFEKLCELDCVKAVDLGNSGDYDLEWLLEICTKTDTVFYSRVSPEDRKEKWEAYIRRIAKVQNKTKARCVLRTLVQPIEKAECQEMLTMWHSLTQ